MQHLLQYFQNTYVGFNPFIDSTIYRTYELNNILKNILLAIIVV